MKVLVEKETGNWPESRAQREGLKTNDIDKDV
jgi:hypothetical protein